MLLALLVICALFAASWWTPWKGLGRRCLAPRPVPTTGAPGRLAEKPQRQRRRGRRRCSGHPLPGPGQQPRQASGHRRPQAAPRRAGHGNSHPADPHIRRQRYRRRGAHRGGANVRCIPARASPPRPIARTSPPNLILLALGSNALTTDDDPQVLHPNHISLSTAVSENLEWLIGCLQMFGATGSVVVVLSTIPRAQLSDAGLAAFRALSDAQRDVVRRFPHCVFLDVERLLEAERTAAGSWTRSMLLHASLGGRSVGDPVVEVDRCSVWSLDPLPRDFPRLRPSDFVDGIHLRPDHYHTIRCAVEELAAFSTFPSVPLPRTQAEAARAAPARAASAADEPAARAAPVQEMMNVSLADE